jgi:integrase
MTKLTVRTVSTAKPQDRDIFLWDDQIPGFGLRVKPSGVRSFFVQYRNRHNQSRRHTIGRFGILAPEEAREKAKRLLANIRDGADPARDREEARQAPSTADLALRYLEEHARPKKRPGSVRTDEINIRLHVLPSLGRTKVAAVTRANISKLHHAMRKTPGAANRVLALMSKMFNLAEKWGLRPDGSNPCRHVERYKECKMERFLSPEELGRLGTVLAEAERTATELPSVIAAIRLLTFTGARLGEILDLKWEHVDFESACLRLPDSKTGAKVIHLSAPTLEVLSGIQRTEGNPWVVAGRDPGKPLVNLRKPWYRIREAAGLDDVRLHDLRHSFASVAVAGGLSLPMIGALLGHSQPATTQRYAHLAADPLKQATDLIGERILAAMSGDSADVVTLPHSKA